MQRSSSKKRMRGLVVFEGTGRKKLTAAHRRQRPQPKVAATGCGELAAAPPQPPSSTSPRCLSFTSSGVSPSILRRVWYELELFGLAAAAAVAGRRPGQHQGACGSGQRGVQSDSMNYHTVHWRRTAPARSSAPVSAHPHSGSIAFWQASLRMVLHRDPARKLAPTAIYHSFH